MPGFNVPSVYFSIFKVCHLFRHYHIHKRILVSKNIPSFGKPRGSTHPISPGKLLVSSSLELAIPYLQSKNMQSETPFLQSKDMSEKPLKREFKLMFKMMSYRFDGRLSDFLGGKSGHHVLLKNVKKVKSS